jgi:adenylate cyclase
LTAVYALPNLTRLQADWNNIVTLDAQLGAKVKTFSVPHNSITRFTLAPIVGATAVTYSLTNLNLSHAKISTLADEAFSGLTNLVDLNLNFNQFTRLPATLDRLTNLEIFSCTDNMLNDLPVGFGKMQKLRVLNVHNNNLRSLPSDIWGCGSLEKLNASSNLLQQFEEPPEDLVGMMGPEAAEVAARKMSIISEPGAKIVMPLPPAGQSLLKLFLADNRLNDDVFHQIAEMPNLQVLNLSFNDIYEIPPGTLASVNRLEALYLSGNKLTSLPSEDLEKLQRLTILHLNGNKLQTLPSELGAIKTLQHLDVGSNVLKYNIANWPYDWNW